MADVRPEPSMEAILASIKRIIADDGPDAGRPVHAADAEVEDADPAAPRDEVEGQGDGALPDAAEPEIREVEVEAMTTEPAETPPAPIPDEAVTSAAPVDAPVAPTAPLAETSAMPAATPTDHAAPPPVVPTTLVSQGAASASRQSLSALAAVARPPQAETSLEGLVREMLRPMLRDWLDANLPSLVESLVAKEIARITAQQD